MKKNILVLTILALLTHSPLWAGECELFEKVIQEGLNASDSPASQESTGVGIVPKDLEKNLESIGAEAPVLTGGINESTGAGVVPNNLEASKKPSTPTNDAPTKVSGVDKSSKNTVLFSSKKEKVTYATNTADPSPEYTRSIDRLYSTSYTGRKYKVPSGYKNTAPKKIYIQLPSDAEIVEKIKQMDSIANTEIAAIKSMPPGMQDSSHVIFLDAGGINNVYLTHTNPLPKNIAPGSPEHLAWAKEYGENVIVKKFPKNGSNESTVELLKMKKKDIAMRETLRQLAPEATLNGKRFIYVPEENLLKSEHEFVKGMKANELRMAQEILMEGPGKKILMPTDDGATKSLKLNYEEAKKLLIDAGFVKNGEIDLERVSENLTALEQFYKDSHNVTKKVWKDQLGSNAMISNGYRNDAFSIIDSSSNLKNNDSLFRIESQKLNPMPQAQSRADQFLNKNGEVGADLNHGLNIIWDPKKQAFIIIDS